MPKVGRPVCEDLAHQGSKEDQWRTNGIAAIIVVFPDEATIESDRDLERLKGEPAIKLE